jgi:carbamate kinase
LLLRAAVVVICGGGGGIPVVRDALGRLHGAAAVIDKDRSAELLATSLEADVLMLLTDVPAIYADWPERAHPIRRIARAQLAARAFEPGSMGPKVEAACRFVRAPHHRAFIGALDDAAAMLRGEAGSEVLSDDAARELAAGEPRPAPQLAAPSSRAPAPARARPGDVA